MVGCKTLKHTFFSRDQILIATKDGSNKQASFNLTYFNLTSFKITSFKLTPFKQTFSNKIYITHILNGNEIMFCLYLFLFLYLNTILYPFYLYAISLQIFRWASKGSSCAYWMCWSILVPFK